jgi:nitroimidazol reductase NimA-like FMN-containing flavoprotein (pyridoxamine 5'-phosphate oxidase superfamily)
MVEYLVKVKLPKMNEREINDLIREQMLCRIAFKGDTYPYIAPFQYVFMNDSLYFHFTNYGKKMRLLKKDNHVCVEIESYLPDLSEYGFVVLRGTLNVVEDPKEKKDVIKKMAEIGKEKFSNNFLHAHGLQKEEGWFPFGSDKKLILMKLEDIVETIGLKSF